MTRNREETVQAKCLIEFCQQLTTKTSRIPLFNRLCRGHQGDAYQLLTKHLPNQKASGRHAFMETHRGEVWLMDWVRLVDGAARARLSIGYVATDIRHPHHTDSPQEALGPTPSIPTPKYESLAKPHPLEKNSQVFPTLAEQKGKKK